MLMQDQSQDDTDVTADNDTHSHLPGIAHASPRNNWSSHKAKSPCCVPERHSSICRLRGYYTACQLQFMMLLASCCLAVLITVADSSSARQDSFVEACRWYDRHCAGYLRDDDLEDIAFLTMDAPSRESPPPPLSQLHC